MHRSFTFGLISIVFLLVPLTGALATWSENGVPLSTAFNDQHGPQIIPDGNGGGIVTWLDGRAGGVSHIYAQRLDRYGNPLWTFDGLAICTDPAGQYYPVITSDGSGGAIIAWPDYRGGSMDIYAQRVNASGVVQWADNGVVVCSAAQSQQGCAIVEDGMGGAIIGWSDPRTGGIWDIYAQRLNASGTAQWITNGVAVCTATDHQRDLEVVSDGPSEAIFTWRDDRSTTNDIYAQRVNFFGNVSWPTNGVAICTAGNNQRDPVILSCSSGGAIIAWEDYRTGNSDIYAQRINSAGLVQWAADGLAICYLTGEQYSPSIASDGADGVIIFWTDDRSGIDNDIYTQRVNSFGNPQWPINGNVVCSATGGQHTVKAASDGAGGAIVSWMDYRNGNNDIYAGRVGATGSVVWTTDGKPVCTAPGQQMQSVLVVDNDGNAIVTWTDERSGYDIYAQRIESRYGYWGRPEPDIISVDDNPADQGGYAVINWKASERDVLNEQTITHYSVWRATDAVLQVAAAASEREYLVDLSDIGPGFQGRGYRLEHTASADYYWEWVGNQDALYAAGYSYLCPTRQDSVAGEPALHYFQVVAHTLNSFRFWPSTADSGYSVDNLAPAPPLMLAADRVGDVVELDWNPSEETEPDFHQYALYRSDGADVVPDPSLFLANVMDTEWTDDTAELSRTYYYIVCATDVHGNLSLPSNQAMVNAVASGIGDSPPTPTSLFLLPNSPNPFGFSTELAFWLPSESDVTLEVYDVAGRRVYNKQLSQLIEGWQRVSFDGRDDAGRLLPSGVYFYRIETPSMQATRKMVINR